MKPETKKIYEDLARDINAPYEGAEHQRDLDDDAIEAAELLAGVTKVQRGDKLIFRFNQVLTMELAELIRRRIAAKLGGTPFLVIGSDVELFVTRQEDDDD